MTAEEEADLRETAAQGGGDEDLPDWVLEKSLRVRVAARLLMKGARTMRTKTGGGESLHKSALQGWRDEQLAKGLLTPSAAWADTIDWAEKFAGTPLHAKALDAVLIYRREMESLEDKNRKAVEGKDEASKELNRKIAELTAQREKSWNESGRNDFWKQRDDLAKKHGSKMSGLETQLLEHRKAQAEAGAGDLKKSMGAGAAGPGPLQSRNSTGALAAMIRGRNPYLTAY